MNEKQISKKSQWKVEKSTTAAAAAACAAVYLMLAINPKLGSVGPEVFGP